MFPKSEKPGYCLNGLDQSSNSTVTVKILHALRVSLERYDLLLGELDDTLISQTISYFNQYATCTNTQVLMDICNHLARQIHEKASASPNPDEQNIQDLLRKTALPRG